MGFVVFPVCPDFFCFPHLTAGSKMWYTMSRSDGKVPEQETRKVKVMDSKREELVAKFEQAKEEFHKFNIGATKFVLDILDGLIEKAGAKDEFFRRHEIDHHGIGSYDTINYNIHELDDNGREREWHNFTFRYRIYENKEGKIVFDFSPSIGSYGGDGEEWSKWHLRRIYVVFGKVLDNYEETVELLNSFTWDKWMELKRAKNMAESELERYDYYVKKEEERKKKGEIMARLVKGIPLITQQKKTHMVNGKCLDEPIITDVVETIVAVTPKKFRLQKENGYSHLEGKEDVVNRVYQNIYKFKFEN